jgi:hypothetical protein
MTRAALLVVLGACGSSSSGTFTRGGDDVPAEKGKTYKWQFDDASGTGDFITVLGAWASAAESTAPSAPNVMRQSGKASGGDFPRAVVKGLVFGDGTVKVRCRPEAGSGDQACGLMFRFADSDNYYVTRANALEGNVRLYRVVKGDRQEFASAEATVKSGEWHTLEASAIGSQLTVKWDGVQVISTSDATYKRGKIGMWTKADSVTAFDDLEAIGE